MTARRGWRPYAALGTIYVVWGSTYMAIAVAVRELPPFIAACLRFLVAGVLMAGIALAFDRPRVWPTRRQWIDYSVIGVLFLGIGNGLVMWAEQRVPSGIAALIVATVPLWVTLLDGLRPGGQPWTVGGWIAVVLGLIGVTLIARPDPSFGVVPLAGIAALQTAALSWTLGSIYSQALPVKLPVFTASAIEMLAGSAALVLESSLMGEDWGLLAHGSLNAWLALLYLVVFGSLVGFTAFAYCLNVLPAGIVTTYAYVNPMVAVTLGTLLLGERLSPGMLGGAAFILVAVILTTRGLRPRARPAPANETR